MEHITIQPLRVRGHGNVLNPQTIENYSSISCELEMTEDSFCLTNPLFFDLFILNNSGRTLNECFTATNLQVDAMVKYNNGNTWGSDEKVANQFLQLYMDGNHIITKTTDNSGIWKQKYTLGRLNEGLHKFQLKFNGIFSQVFYLHVEKSVGFIQLHTDKTETYVQENITFTAVVKDENNNPLANKSVEFIDNRGITIATATTDENGESSFSYTETVPASIIVRAKCTDVISNSVTGTYYPHRAESIRCNNDKNNINFGESILLEVGFYDHFGIVVPGNICIDDADDEEYSIEENENKYYINYNPNRIGTKSLKIYLCGYPYTIYVNKEIIVQEINTSLTLTAPDWNIFDSSGSVSVSATLKDEDNNYLSGKIVKLYSNNVLISTEITNSNGIASFSVPTSTRNNLSLKAILDSGGDSPSDATKTMYIGANVTLNVTRVI